ncbi:MAG: hypothetical protein KAI43_03510 [Candidatus Aureabacteria bacterium]|nr:hypothetical protein [Candidatus Auribacterota bacterium]
MLKKIRISFSNEGMSATVIKGIKIIYIKLPKIIRDYSTYIFCKLLGERLVFSLVFSVFKFKCKYNLFLGKERCLWLGKHLSLHVLKTIYMNPNEIKYQSKGGIVPYIQSGDWDLKKKPFKLHDTIKEIYEDNIPLKETAQYKRMKAAVEDKDWGNAYWCRSQNELDNHFKILTDALSDIKNGKYLSQNELSQDIQNKKKELYYPNEILVSIDRDGNYLHEKGGSHRLSMAKICNLSRIPVVVIRKHYEYVKNKECFQQ